MQYSSSFSKIASLCLMQSNIYIDISFKQNFQDFMNWVKKGNFAKSEIIQNNVIFLNAWLMKYV